MEVRETLPELEGWVQKTGTSGVSIRETSESRNNDFSDSKFTISTPSLSVLNVRMMSGSVPVSVHKGLGKDFPVDLRVNSQTGDKGKGTRVGERYEKHDSQSLSLSGRTSHLGRLEKTLCFSLGFRKNTGQIPSRVK